MPRPFVIAVLMLFALPGNRDGIVADEIVIGTRLEQRTLGSLGLDDLGNPDQSRLITAGELWQFFHDQGVTSVDSLTLNLDCGGNITDHAGSIRFQIQDPNSGSILTSLNINSTRNRLEVPLEFDYMKRFSPGSQELIRLDLSGLDALANSTKVTVDSEGELLGTFSIALIIGFFSFWVIVFFMLNRFTKPLAEDEAEEIVIHLSPVAAPVDGTAAIDTESAIAGTAAAASRTQSISKSSGVQRTGSTKMVSAQ